MGDWVNVLRHQRAACKIFTYIFSPETAMQTHTGRMCRAWCARFDAMVSLLGGFRTELSREWFTCVNDFTEERLRVNPSGIHWKIENGAARLYLVSYDMSVLCAQEQSRGISETEYIQEHENMTVRLMD